MNDRSSNITGPSPIRAKVTRDHLDVFSDIELLNFECPTSRIVGRNWASLNVRGVPKTLGTPICCCAIGSVGKVGSQPTTLTFWA